jgi:hypothetical protein
MVLQLRWLGVWWLVLAASTACRGSIVRNAGPEAEAFPGGPGAHANDAQDGPAAGAAQGGPGGSAEGGASGAAGSDAGGAADRCLDAVFQASAAPLRRLSEREYRNTVADLFTGVALPALEVAPDARKDGFDNAAAGQAPSPLAVEQYERAARLVADAALADLGAWASCNQDTPACAAEMLQTFAADAYRRPLSGAEGDALTSFLDTSLADSTPMQALHMGIEAVLQSPYFLYRPELGSSQVVGRDALALDGYEMASRLSYFFWATMPDSALLAAAASGELDGEAGVRAQARRLLDDPRARPVMNDFFAQWLGLYRLEALSLDPNVFPELDDALRSDLYDSALRYVERALWRSDSWTLLMSGSYGYVNDRLAPLFGVPAPGGDQLVYTELDAAQRSGVLTQPGLLASTSHGIRHSPILRGVAMLDSMLCAAPPAPPPGVLAMAEDLPVDESLLCTTRDEVSMKHTQRAECRACHDAIDGAGFNFESYDALGRYRSQENGCAIDASGSYPGTDIGDVGDAVELAGRLAGSETATGCFGEHLFRYALGRRQSTADRCEIEAVAAHLRGGDSLQQVIIELVATPSFRSRPPLP